MTLISDLYCTAVSDAPVCHLTRTHPPVWLLLQNDGVRTTKRTRETNLIVSFFSFKLHLTLCYLHFVFAVF